MRQQPDRAGTPKVAPIAGVPGAILRTRPFLVPRDRRVSALTRRSYSCSDLVGGRPAAPAVSAVPVQPVRRLGALRLGLARMGRAAEPTSRLAPAVRNETAPDPRSGGLQRRDRRPDGPMQARFRNRDRKNPLARRNPGRVRMGEITGTASGVTSISPAQRSAIFIVLKTGKFLVRFDWASARIDSTGSGSRTRTASNGEGPSRGQVRGIFYSSMKRRPIRRRSSRHCFVSEGRKSKKSRKLSGTIGETFAPRWATV